MARDLGMIAKGIIWGVTPLGTIETFEKLVEQGPGALDVWDRVDVGATGLGGLA